MIISKRQIWASAFLFFQGIITRVWWYQFLLFRWKFPSYIPPMQPFFLWYDLEQSLQSHLEIVCFYNMVPSKIIEHTDTCEIESKDSSSFIGERGSQRVNTKADSLACAHKTTKHACIMSQDYGTVGQSPDKIADNIYPERLIESDHLKTCMEMDSLHMIPMWVQKVQRPNQILDPTSPLLWSP